MVKQYNLITPIWHPYYKISQAYETDLIQESVLDCKLEREEEEGTHSLQTKEESRSIFVFWFDQVQDCYLIREEWSRLQGAHYNCSNQASTILNTWILICSESIPFGSKLYRCFITWGYIRSSIHLTTRKQDQSTGHCIDPIACIWLLRTTSNPSKRPRFKSKPGKSRNQGWFESRTSLFGL